MRDLAHDLASAIATLIFIAGAAYLAAGLTL